MRADIDLRERRVFLAIADQLHFARAAEHLGITASRASQSLRSLETKLGVRLVERTGRRLRGESRNRSLIVRGPGRPMDP